MEVPPLEAGSLLPFIGRERLGALADAAAQARHALGGATVWNISSTAAGGGVAEMLPLLVGYARGSGVDARWVVLDCDEAFFQITKRLHNRLHGATGDGGALGRTESVSYSAVMAANAAALTERVRRDDVAVLHDPQAAGLAGALSELGVRVIWRCHVGTERTNGFTDEAWAFLTPQLEGSHAFVFSHRGFVPRHLGGKDVWVIPPSIDPLSPKNPKLSAATVRALLGRIDLAPGPDGAGTMGSASTRGAGLVASQERLVVQVSRWDRLKDMQGVLEGFADRMAGRSDCRLALVGPAVAEVSDDPEGAAVLGECVAAWESLPTRQRDAIRLVTLPMDDLELNALMVNAVQRRADVVVQKSLEEGFGLTVAEAMWKSRPVVASAVGGIVDQVAPGTGVLLADPSDLVAFGDALADLLARSDELAAMGRRARRRIRSHFLSDRHLVDYARLLVHVAGV